MGSPIDRGVFRGERILTKKRAVHLLLVCFVQMPRRNPGEKDRDQGVADVKQGWDLLAPPFSSYTQTYVNPAAECPFTAGSALLRSLPKVAPCYKAAFALRDNTDAKYFAEYFVLLHELSEAMAVMYREQPGTGDFFAMKCRYVILLDSSRS